MRLSIFHFLPLLCFLPTLFASSLFETSDYSLNHLLARQSLADVSLCANVTLEVPLNVTTCVNTTSSLGLPISTCTTVAVNQTLAQDVCLCVQAGALTPNSLATLGALVDTDGTVTNLLLGTVNGVAQYTRSSLLSYVERLATRLLTSRKSSCNYPTGATPLCGGGSCNYTCPSGQYVCGTNPGQCIDNSRACVSGQPVRRRSYVGDITDENCPVGKTACAIPSTRFSRQGFECLDTRSDIESCGACSSPLPGRPTGVDCTAIEGALDVECRSGACVVHKCRAGWQISASTAACEPEEEGSSQHLYVIQEKTRSQAKRDSWAPIVERQSNSKKLKMTRSWKA